MGGLISWHSLSSFLRVRRSWLATGLGLATHIDTSGGVLESCFILSRFEEIPSQTAFRTYRGHWLDEDHMHSFTLRKLLLLPGVSQNSRGSGFLGVRKAKTKNDTGERERRKDNLYY